MAETLAATAAEPVDGPAAITVMSPALEQRMEGVVHEYQRLLGEMECQEEGVSGGVTHRFAN